MSRRHRLGSGRRYEELLNGSRRDDSMLSAVLDAARAPGTRDEMAGLPEARAAFMSVPYVRSRPAASVSSLPAATRTAAGRLLALKFLAAVSGATLIGGAAYAATGAKLLGGGSPHPHKHSTSTSTSAPGHAGRFQIGQVAPTPGAPLPAPAGKPSDLTPKGNSSIARSEHPPSNPATPPGRTHTPGPTNSHSPKPHHTPSPHDTKPHHTPSPGPHTTPASAHENARPLPTPSEPSQP
jgi:hypothetical protein